MKEVTSFVFNLKQICLTQEVFDGNLYSFVSNTTVLRHEINESKFWVK